MAVGPERSIEAIVAAAVGGEEVAWYEIVEIFAGSIHRYALARLRDRQAAEDVTQDVFVVAVTGLSRLRERTKPGVEAWLLGIARHKVADHIRAAQRERRGGRLVIADAEPDPEALALARAGLDDLYQVMDTLSEPQRDLLVRRFVLDHSLEHVANATRRPLGAVKAMQRRALAALARRLRTEKVT